MWPELEACLDPATWKCGFLLGGGFRRSHSHRNRGFGGPPQRHFWNMGGSSSSWLDATSRCRMFLNMILCGSNRSREAGAWSNILVPLHQILQLGGSHGLKVPLATTQIYFMPLSLQQNTSNVTACICFVHCFIPAPNIAWSYTGVTPVFAGWKKGRASIALAFSSCSWTGLSASPAHFSAMAKPQVITSLGIQNIANLFFTWNPSLLILEKFEKCIIFQNFVSIF